MTTGPGTGDGLQVNIQDLRQAAQQVARLSAAVRGLASRPPAACSTAASACPGWAIGASSSAAGARWQRALNAHATSLAGAGDRLTAAAASYETAEAALAGKISAIGQQASR